MTKKQFLYETIYNDLREKIECGELKPGDKLDVEGDMVTHYGVSAITVKKALNLLAEEHRIRRIKGKGSFVMIRPEDAQEEGDGATDGRIEDGRTVDESSVTGNNQTEAVHPEVPILGVVFEHISSSYGLQMMYELERQARMAGYHLYPCFSYGKQELETKAICYLREVGAKGIFVMPCHGSYYNTEILRLVIDGYPTVLIDKRLDGISLDSVRTDNVESISQLVRYFAETGKKKIGFITVEETGTTSLGERNEGFYQGISRYEGIPVGKCSLPYIDYEQPAEVRGEIYREQIGEYIEKYRDDLEGIICGEYSVAMETETVLKEKGLHGMIEVCCMDENHIGSGQYRLTHICQDEQKLAQCAMECMRKRLNGNTGEEKDYLIPGIFMEKTKSWEK